MLCIYVLPRNRLFSEPGCWKQACGLYVLLLFLILTLPVRPIISKSTWQIFAQFLGLIELRCYDNHILLVLVHGCRRTQAARGAARRAKVGLCPTSSCNTFINRKLWLLLLLYCIIVGTKQQGDIGFLHVYGRCTICKIHKNTTKNKHYDVSSMMQTLLQSCPWVHFVWPNPTQPISWLTQPNPLQVEKIGPNPTQPNPTQPNPIQLTMELTVW